MAKMTKYALAQCGEMLVAALLNGHHLGGPNPGHDVFTTHQLLKQGNCPLREKIVSDGDYVWVEVKTKAAMNPSGPAEVVHVSISKIFGGKGKPPMTHMIVVLVNHDGEKLLGVTEAWLAELDFVKRNLRGTYPPYVSVKGLRAAAKAEEKVIWEISEHFHPLVPSPQGM